MWRNIKALWVKIVLLVGAIMMVVVSILVIFAAISLRGTATSAARDRAVAVAQSEAGAIKAEVQVALDAARTMAHVLTVLKDPDNPIRLGRQDVHAMLRQVLVENPQFLGTYTLWEPNAFDGRDAEFANAPAHDQSGRFIPYWVRGPSGEIRVEALVDYETEGIGDWYLVPRKTKQEVIIDPFLYPIQDEQVLLSSLVVPIVVDGRFYGIAGVDFRVDFMQSLADRLDIYDKTGRMALISYQGVLAGVTGQADLIGKPVTEFDPNFDAERLARIQRGESFMLYADDQLGVYVPVWFGDAATPWCVHILVPQAKIVAEAMAAVWGMIGAGTVLALAAIAMLWWTAVQIVRPIRQITTAAQAVSGGDYSVLIQVETRDEVGALAEAFNSMTRQLADSISTLEQRVAERTHNLMAAAEVSHATTELLDVETLLPQVVEIVREQFDLYYVGLFLTDQEGKVALLRAGTGEAGRQMIAQGWQLPVGGASMIGRCVATGQADIQLDVGEAAVRFDNPLLPRTRSEMALPLRSRGRVIGAMSIQSDRPAAFEQADISTLQNMADQIAAAILNDRLYAQARAAIESLQAMQQRYQVRAWTEYAQTADVVSYEASGEGVAVLDDAVLSEARQAVTQGRPVILAREQTQNQHSALVAPITFRGGIIGALGIHDEDGSRQWSERDIVLVQAVIERMGQVAESLRLLDDTQRREARERLTRQITDQIRGALTVDEAVRRAIKQLGDALDAEMVAQMGSDLETVSGAVKERG